MTSALAWKERDRVPPHPQGVHFREAAAGAGLKLAPGQHRSLSEITASAG